VSGGEKKSGVHRKAEPGKKRPNHGRKGKIKDELTTKPDIYNVTMQRKKSADGTAQGMMISLYLNTRGGREPTRRGGACGVGYTLEYSHCQKTEKNVMRGKRTNLRTEQEREVQEVYKKKPTIFSSQQAEVERERKQGMNKRQKKTVNRRAQGKRSGSCGEGGGGSEAYWLQRTQITKR